MSMFQLRAGYTSASLQKQSNITLPGPYRHTFNLLQDLMYCKQEIMHASL